MRHPRIIIAGIGLAAVAAVGGVTAASAGGSAASSTPSASPTAAAVTVRTAPATRRPPRRSWSTPTACRCTSTGPTRRRGRWSPEAWPSCGRR